MIVMQPIRGLSRDAALVRLADVRATLFAAGDRSSGEFWPAGVPQNLLVRLAELELRVRTVTGQIDDALTAELARLERDVFWASPVAHTTISKRQVVVVAGGAGVLLASIAVGYFAWRAR